MASGSAPALRHSCAACRLSGSPGSPSPALEDSGDFGQQIAAPGRELAEFGHGGGFLGPGGLPPPGVTSGCAGELGDEDPVRVRSRAILIH